MINLHRCAVNISSKLHGTLVRLTSSGDHPTAGLIGNIGILVTYRMFIFRISYSLKNSYRSSRW